MKLFSAFNPSLREQWAALTAPREQFGVQCLAQGHFGLWSVGDGNRTADSRIIGRLLNQLSYTATPYRDILKTRAFGQRAQTNGRRTHGEA